MVNWDSNTIRARGKEVIGGGNSDVFLLPWLAIGQGKWVYGLFTGDSLPPNEKNASITPLFAMKDFEVEGGWRAVFTNVQEYHLRNPKATSGQQSQSYYENATKIGVKLNNVADGLTPHYFYHMQWTGSVLTKNNRNFYTFDAIRDEDRGEQKVEDGHKQVEQQQGATEKQMNNYRGQQEKTFDANELPF